MTISTFFSFLRARLTRGSHSTLDDGLRLMTSPANEESQKAVERARNLQSHLDQVMQDEHDTEGLLEKLDHLIKELFELSQAWEPVDPEMANRVRLQEKNLHLLRGRVERLGETEADEAASIIAEIKAELANFKGR